MELNLEHGKIVSKSNFLCRKFQEDIEGIFLHPKILNKPRLSSHGKMQGFFDVEEPEILISGQLSLFLWLKNSKKTASKIQRVFYKYTLALGYNQ